MQALVFTEPGKVENRNFPNDPLRPGEVSVNVGLVGICGSDVLGYLGKSPGRVPPLILGHEFTGLVDGRRVVVNPIVSCGRCDACLAGQDNICPEMKLFGLHRHGAMRQSINVPEANLVEYGDGIADEVMTLTEPFACALHSVGMVSLKPGCRTLVIGFGCLGSMTGAVLRHKGVQHVDFVDPAPSRAAFGKRIGVRQLTADAIKPNSYDYVFDCVGSVQTHASAGRSVRSGGHIVLIGYKKAAGGIDFADIVRREYHLHGVMGCTAGTFRESARLLEQGILDVDGLIKIFNLAEGQQAFDDAREANSTVIKNMLRVADHEQ